MSQSTASSVIHSSSSGREQLAEAGLRIVDQSAIDRLAQEAEASPRRRAHLLLHSGHDDQVQRLLIALQLGTYVRPHHHSEQWEMLVLLRGSGRLLSFSEDGRVLSRLEMNKASPIVQIPIGVWHGFVVLERDTVVMEIKPGPYRPNEFAEWAPAEGSPDVPAFLRRVTSTAL
jgi:cupin fold WbuC family metalloprotein